MKTANSSAIENYVTSDICAMATELLGKTVISAERIGGQGNNRVYALQCGNAEKYLAKFYFQHPADKRDRLAVEFLSLSFLSSQGIENIPRPIAICPEKSCGIYEFIEGRKIAPSDISQKDIECAIDFISRLRNLNKTARDKNIAPASDACFSIKAITASVEARLKRFDVLKEEAEEYRELDFFLRDDFKPFLTTLTEWAQTQCQASGVSYAVEIPLEERTLSPSDFGFHNAIRTHDGGVVFLDFEYFGWDDPAKTTVDFLFHPAMALTEPLKKLFVRRMLETFSENKQLTDRVLMAYPLFGLKWCMIFLNEFIPNDFSRRAFASLNPLDQSQLRRQQLLKAKNLFRELKETYKEFPYG